MKGHTNAFSFLVLDFHDETWPLNAAERAVIKNMDLRVAFRHLGLVRGTTLARDDNVVTYGYI